MTRHLWLALPLALLACGPSGGSGEDDGGEGGSLCIDTKDRVLALMEGVDGATSGPGLWRDGSRPKLGNGQLQAQVTTIDRAGLSLTTVAGQMAFGFGGELPGGVEAGAATVYQRDGWDVVQAGDVTLAVYWAASPAAPPVPKIVDGGAEKPAFTSLTLEDACTAEVACGELGIRSVVVNDDGVFPGREREVNGWTVANRGVATAGDRCPAQAVTLITAWRKAPAE